MLFHSFYISVHFPKSINIPIFRHIQQRLHWSLNWETFKIRVIIITCPTKATISISKVTVIFLPCWEQNVLQARCCFRCHFLGTPILQMEHDSIIARSTALFQAVNDAADCYLHLAAEICARDIRVISRSF